MVSAKSPLHTHRQHRLVAMRAHRERRRSLGEGPEEVAPKKLPEQKSGIPTAPWDCSHAAPDQNQNAYSIDTYIVCYYWQKIASLRCCAQVLSAHLNQCDKYLKTWAAPSNRGTPGQQMESALMDMTNYPASRCVGPPPRTPPSPPTASKPSTASVS